MPLISISDNQREPMPPVVNWLATIHHGLPPQNYPFNAKGGDYLASLGRISPEKRSDRAIEIAKAAGVRLKIAAKVDKVDQDYFHEVIEPMLDHPLIEFIGEINETQKIDFLGNALALLFPIDWREPFGIVMIEAMSWGTPVIAWRHDSVPEVIGHGASGVVLETMEEAVAAVAQAQVKDRRGVRNWFEARFTAEQMAKNNVEANKGIIELQ